MQSEKPTQVTLGGLIFVHVGLHLFGDSLEFLVERFGHHRVGIGGSVMVCVDCCAEFCGEPPAVSVAAAVGAHAVVALALDSRDDSAFAAWQCAAGHGWFPSAVIRMSEMCMPDSSLPLSHLTVT